MADLKPTKRRKLDPSDLTVPWVTAELMMLAETTRPFDDEDALHIPNMDRHAVGAVAEHRKTLGMLLDIAQSNEIERLVTANEALLEEIELLESSSEGHANRVDSTLAPPTATH